MSTLLRSSSALLCESGRGHLPLQGKPSKLEMGVHQVINHSGSPWKISPNSAGFPPVMCCKWSECKGPLASAWPHHRQKQQSREGGKRASHVWWVMQSWLLLKRISREKPWKREKPWWQWRDLPRLDPPLVIQFLGFIWRGLFSHTHTYCGSMVA